MTAATPTTAATAPRTRPAVFGRPRPHGAPTAVRAAFLLWWTALAMGCAETALGAAGELASPGGMPGTAVALVVAARLAVTAAMGALAFALLAGRGWARAALAVLLGVVGLLSMVYEPVGELAAGVPLAEVFPTDGPSAIAFLVVRGVHVAAVLTAVVAMFLPTAGAYIRDVRTTR